MNVQASAATKLDEVRAHIARSAAAFHRPVSSVVLIAVSKTFEASAIEPVLAAGHRDFGENRVQEAQRKWPDLVSTFPDVRLHLIGPLQSNKARDAVRLFYAIHSLDRESLAEHLAQEMAKSGRAPLLFVQVNTGTEPQKSGVAPPDAALFVRRCREVHGLIIHGLMCIPPEAQAPAPHFAMLRQIGRDCELPFLSMGMSADYETAVKLGATHVRVGSAIFGHRHTASSI